MNNFSEITQLHKLLLEQNYIDFIRKSTFYNDNDQVSQRLMDKVGTNVHNFRNEMLREQWMDNWTYSWYCFVRSLDQDQLEILGY